MRTISFDISGMSCDACVEKVQHALNKLDGVNHAEVALNPGIATVNIDPNHVDAALLESVIDRLGYHATARAEETARA